MCEILQGSDKVRAAPFPARVHALCLISTEARFEKIDDFVAGDAVARNASHRHNNANDKRSRISTNGEKPR